MQFLVAIHHPEGFDGSTEGPEVIADIDALNDEMVAAGIRKFVGGLRPPSEARSIRATAQGQIVTDGVYLETKEYVGGFWVLDVPSMDEALAWGRKANKACRAPVEVRPFYQMPPSVD